MKLYKIAEEHHAALSMLNDMEDLTPEIIEDSMAALDAELETKVVNCAKYLKELEAEAKAIKEAEQGMATRRKALESRAENFKVYIRSAMLKCELMAVKDVECPVKLTKPSKVVVIDDESLLGEGFIRTKREPVKTAIKQALSAGVPVIGAHLEDGQYGLRIG